LPLLPILLSSKFPDDDSFVSLSPGTNPITAATEYKRLPGEPQHQHNAVSPAL
jgi:hypothetical protein